MALCLVFHWQKTDAEYDYQLFSFFLFVLFVCILYLFIYYLSFISPSENQKILC